jgi:hypothetical protein
MASQNTARQKIAISRALRQQMASAANRVVKGLRAAANNSHANSDGASERVSSARTRG